jgi:transcriptional regulator with XRE-family HTH domain
MGTEPSSKTPSLWVAWPEEVADVSLGKKLKELRKEKGWSQDEFAYNAQIDGRQVSRYENDRVMPSIEVIIKMAKAYNVSIDYLLLDDVPRRSLEATQVSKLSERITRLGPVSEDDERSLLHLIDAIEAKNKLKEIAAGIG